MKTHNVISIIFLFLVIVGNVDAASFDCKKATTETDKFICSNQYLSKLDRLMTQTYTNKLRSSSDPVTIKASQRHWLHDKRGQSSNFSQLKTAYENRILELMMVGNAKSEKAFEVPGQYKVSESWPTGVRDHNFAMHEENFDLCYSFEAALRARKVLPAPLTCEIPLDESAQFTNGNWSPIEKSRMLSLVQRFEIQKMHGSEAKARIMSDEVTTRLKKSIESGEINVEMATLPIGPKGDKWTILRYQRRSCAFEFFRVENSDFTSVKQILGLEFPTDVFLFKDRAYFVAHSYRDSDDGFKFRLPGPQPLIFVSKMYDNIYRVDVCRLAYWGASLIEKMTGAIDQTKNAGK